MNATLMELTNVELAEINGGGDNELAAIGVGVALGAVTILGGIAVLATAPVSVPTVITLGVLGLAGDALAAIGWW